MVQKEDNELKNPLRNGIIKRIHVNQHNIRQNKNSENQKPVITCKTSNSNIKCNTFRIQYYFHGCIINKDKLLELKKNNFFNYHVGSLKDFLDFKRLF